MSAHHGDDDELEFQQLQHQLEETRSRYEALRSRKTVRAALGIANVRDRALQATRGQFAKGSRATSSQQRDAELQSALLRWPIDHYYSPVPDYRALAAEPGRSRIWPSPPRQTPGIDWRDAEQVALVRDELGAQTRIDFPDGPTGDPRDYHPANEMFSLLDAWFLQGMLRHLRPRRMIEVGCGWSSLVTAKVNREYLEGALRFTCIEPYPPQFLERGVEGISGLIASPAEEVAIENYLDLATGDILFIDSSHTVKTGSDVVFLLTEVLPRLNSGVVVHIHDIFLPWDYPQPWVFEGRAWNEQYAVQAFLEFNSAFRILLGSAWMVYSHPDVLAAEIPGYPAKYQNGGGSLWIQRA